MGSVVSYISRNGFSSREAKESLHTQSFKLSQHRDYVNIGNNSKYPAIFNSNSTIANSNNNYETDKPIANEYLDINTIIDKMNNTLYIENRLNSINKAFQKSISYYNRFKTAELDISLHKGFPHVYFVRPSCNILTNDGSDLNSSLKYHELFSYTWKSSPWLLKELVNVSGQSHDFMLSLSNYIDSFSTSDEYINTDSYGKTFTGYKIAYGKSYIESRAAGTFDVEFHDDKYLHIYQLIRLWVQYINDAYRGVISPTAHNIINKILDYAGACYYIITAEDGETIIFWSKYYGIFPTTMPSTQYSWGGGNTIINPKVPVQFQYSFKEDFNPFIINEFNYNARINLNGTNYEPIYDNNLGHTGRTWVKVPFIETLDNKNNPDCPYIFKLRHIY